VPELSDIASLPSPLVAGVSLATRPSGVTLAAKDRNMLKLDGKLGNPPIRICKPKMPFQTKLEVASADAEA